MRAALALILLLTGTAAAGKPAPSPSAATTLTPAETEALALLQVGTEALDKGDLDAAFAAFQRANELVPARANPYRLLGNVHFRRHECERAIAAFDEFLKRAPEGDQPRGDVMSLRQRCEEEVKARAVARPPVIEAQDTRSAEPNRSPPSVAAWMKPAGIVGLGVGAASLGLGIAALAIDGRGSCADPEPVRCPKTFTTLPHGVALTTFGAVAAATGGLLLWLGSRGHGESRRTALVPVVAGDGFGVFANGRF